MKILLDTSAYVGFKRNNAELVDIVEFPLILQNAHFWFNYLKLY